MSLGHNIPLPFKESFLQDSSIIVAKCDRLFSPSLLNAHGDLGHVIINNIIILIAVFINKSEYIRSLLFFGLLGTLMSIK